VAMDALLSYQPLESPPSGEVKAVGGSRGNLFGPIAYGTRVFEVYGHCSIKPLVDGVFIL